MYSYFDGRSKKSPKIFSSFDFKRSSINKKDAIFKPKLIQMFVDIHICLDINILFIWIEFFPPSGNRKDDIFVVEQIWLFILVVKAKKGSGFNESKSKAHWKQ